MKTKKPRHEWEAILRAWAGSGKSLSDYAKQENISYKSLCNWKQKLSKTNHEHEGFLELTSSAQNVPGITQGFTVHVAHGIRIEIHERLSNDVYEELVKLIKELSR